MKDRTGITKYEISQTSAPENSLTPLNEILSEEARLLSPLTENLAINWAELYLNTFGRSAFFSSQRVHKIFKELVELFVACLQEKRHDLYMANLEEKGLAFSRLGVPFDEIIISLHLFEQVCADSLFNSQIPHTKSAKMMLAMREIHNQGLAALAVSYFENTKNEMQSITDGLLEENASLKKELAEAKDFLLAQTMKELDSMQLVISGINHKLRRRVYQLGRLQKISEVLDGEAHLPKLMKMASHQMLALCPENSNLFFAFFDEERKKVNVYHQESRSSSQCDLIKTFFFSELPKAFQDALYDENKKHGHFNNYENMPAELLDVFAVKNQRDFLLTPIRQYRDVVGFLLLGVPVENLFSKNNYKFFQRVGQALSKAIANALIFTKSKQRDDFELILDQLNRKKIGGGSVETVLDFCLGSLIDLLGVERSSLMRYHEDQKELRVCAAKGYKVYPISGAQIKWGEGIAGTALRDGKIISIAKMKDAKTYKQPEVKVKSLLCVPLIDQNKPLGVVNMSTINYYKNFEKSDIEMAHHVINRMADILKELTGNPSSPPNL